MRTYNTCLEAKVGERNACHAKLIAVIPVILAAIRPFVGQKILNQGYVKSAKFQAAIPDLSDADDQVWVTADQYGVKIHIKSTGLYKDRRGNHHSAQYEETCWHIGETDGYNLKSLNERPPGIRIDYSVREILLAREDVIEAKKALSAAQSRLGGFGEYDNF